MHICRRLIAFLLSLLLIQSSAVCAFAAENPHLLRTQTKSVSVFKNGLGFFTREGTAKKRDGWVLAQHIPPAKFGTLAIYSTDENETVDIVGSGPGEVVEFDGVDAAEELETKRRRLEASLHLQIQLTYEENRQRRSAAGKLLSVGPSFAILDTGSQSIAVPIAAVSRLQVLNMPLRIHTTREGEKESDDAKIGIAYLSQGITWIPEYSVEILDKETAQLTLRGTLVNEAEDLIHCDINFVVGVPHFAHSGFMAPIAVGQAIRTIGTAVAPTQVQSQIMNRAAIVSRYNTSDQFKSRPAVVETPVAQQPGDAKSAAGNLPQISGPGGNDFTVYTKHDMTLRRGERAIVTLFQRKVRYTHIYRWSPPARMEHFLQLHNESGTAWTTGPYLALSKGHPLSEDLLQYTPQGGCCEIPVSAAINIAHSQAETEVERKLKAYSPSSNRHYDLVTLEGELRVRNFEDEDVEVVVTASPPGRPVNASHDGTTTMDSSKLKLLERTGKVVWTLTLKPKESLELTYQYERYVPSQ